MATQLGYGLIAFFQIIRWRRHRSDWISFRQDKKGPPYGRAFGRIIAFLADRLFSERFRDNEDQNCATDAPAEKQIEEGVSGRGHG